MKSPLLSLILLSSPLLSSIILSSPLLSSPLLSYPPLLLLNIYFSLLSHFVISIFTFFFLLSSLSLLCFISKFCYSDRKYLSYSPLASTRTNFNLKNRGTFNFINFFNQIFLNFLNFILNFTI